jgi:hypothetical protein
VTEGGLPSAFCKGGQFLALFERPERFELPTFWFVAARSTLPNLARGVANRTDSASWGKSLQAAFSFLYFTCCIFAVAFCNLRYIFVTASRSSRSQQGANLGSYSPRTSGQDYGFKFAAEGTSFWLPGPREKLG